MFQYFLQIAPPPSADNDTVLLWVVGTLILAVGGLFGIYQKAIRDVKKAHELRIVDRDNQITNLNESIEKERSEITRLTKERQDLLIEIQKSLDMMVRVTDSASNSMNEIKGIILKMVSK